jgi:pyruvate/2-oxoglutarate dehydrogenase complex dihydrolipoamide acyltransferase (E2) component
MGQTDRQARIAQLRAQIERLQQELAQLEREEERGPYQEYVDRVRAAGQVPKPQGEVERYITAHAQLEQDWIRLGRPSQGWPRLSVLVRLRDLLHLPPLNGTSAAGPAAAAAAQTAPAPTPAARPAAAGGARSAPPPPSITTVGGRYQPATVPREQLIEMHNPILNEIVELNKRATEEFKNSKVHDGVASLERSMYLLERVAQAPPAMQAVLNKIVDDAMRAQGVNENERGRLSRVKDRAAELAQSSPA